MQIRQNISVQVNQPRCAKIKNACAQSARRMNWIQCSMIWRPMDSCSREQTWGETDALMIALNWIELNWRSIQHKMKRRKQDFRLLKDEDTIAKYSRRFEWLPTSNDPAAWFGHCRWERRSRNPKRSPKKGVFHFSSSSPSRITTTKSNHQSHTIIEWWNKRLQDCVVCQSIESSLMITWKELWRWRWRRVLFLRFWEGGVFDVWWGCVLLLCVLFFVFLFVFLLVLEICLVA